MAVTFARGLGIMSLESSRLAVRLSLLPNSTSQEGPPVRTTASLAAMMMMSAQETVLGQTCSKASLISSITSNALNEFMLDRAFFSPAMVGVSSNNTEPSQPCQYHQKKNIKIKIIMCTDMKWRE
eukprot:Gb_40153 [translate_table: standard]